MSNKNRDHIKIKVLLVVTKYPTRNTCIHVNPKRLRFLFLLFELEFRAFYTIHVLVKAK